ncbi:MAG: hypothetical protein VW495_00835, partial [Rhodobiaceae bacterium]
MSLIYKICDAAIWKDAVT